MAEKPFKLEIEYFGLKVAKKLDKLEDAVGLTLSLEPFVKVGIRDMSPHSTFHNTVGMHQQLPWKRPPPFQIYFKGDDGSLSLVPISMDLFGGRYITVNWHMPPPGVDARNTAIDASVPLAVPGWRPSEHFSATPKTSCDWAASTDCGARFRWGTSCLPSDVCTGSSDRSVCSWFPRLV